MSVLLDSVDLEDWAAVVTGALRAAKSGDQQARSWLACYLMGRPEAKAPTPLNLIVQQLSGSDPLVERLAAPHMSRVVSLAPLLGDQAFDEDVLSRVTEELEQKLPSQP